MAIGQPPNHCVYDKEKDEEITRIISGRRVSRKERERYEVKEDQTFGDSLTFGQTAFLGPSSRSTNGRGAEKAHRDPVGCKSFGLVAQDRREKRTAVPIVNKRHPAGEMRKAS
jgi:hypothetical protein